MIPRECKRLAEVDFQIAVVSKHAAREKSIRHGHPSTLHLWWARRPLALSRAVLLVVRHVTIFGHGHGLQRAIIDESQHRTPERLVMAQH